MLSNVTDLKVEPLLRNIYKSSLTIEYITFLIVEDKSKGGEVMTNEFLKLSSSPLMNLEHTYRYSGTKLVEAESLSQHIVDTIMMGLKIIDKINGISEKTLIEPSDYVMKAVYHDLEEVITGDIPRPVKYFNNSTLNSLRGVADKVAVKFFDEQFNEGLVHYTIWDDAKRGDAGYILKLVDTLVVVNKVVKEVNLLHNAYFLRVAHEVSFYLQEIKDVDYFSDERINDYLSSLVLGALECMEDTIKDNEDIMQNLGIYNHSMI